MRPTFPWSFTINMDVSSVFDRRTNSSGLSLTEDCTVLDIRLAYRFATIDKASNMFVKGRNLIAVRYTINSGFSIPKVVFMGGVEVTS